jgi:hypothetical protein
VRGVAAVGPSIISSCRMLQYKVNNYSLSYLVVTKFSRLCYAKCFGDASAKFVAQSLFLTPFSKVQGLKNIPIMVCSVRLHPQGSISS